MKSERNTEARQRRWTRRRFIGAALAGAGLGAGAGALWQALRPGFDADVLAIEVADYGTDLGEVLSRGLAELGITPREVRGKRILLKPNLVEPHAGAGHINTHPLVVRGAIEAFLRLDAAEVLVGEGPGHRRDTLLVIEESGLAEVLFEDRTPFLDLNYDAGYTRQNAGPYTGLRSFTFPRVLRSVDWIVSLAKMKTHHWAGVTLSMKNLFGLMPGVLYGWPKNSLHYAGLQESIVDIAATLRPHFAIVDGIVGMEGDGPIMGTPRRSGVIVMGRNPPAVDATCARIMGVDPHAIPYLDAVDGWLGPVTAARIRQRGEDPAALRSDFVLLDHIEAHQGIRLKTELPP